MIKKIVTCAALALWFVSGSADAMKYGSPFRLNISSFVGGMQFGTPEDALVFPAGNGMRENDVLAQLRNIAKLRCQSALNTGLQNSVFSMEKCFEWFDPHLQYFSQYIFKQLSNHSHEFFEGENYSYSDGVYVVRTGEPEQNPDHIVLTIACRDLSVSKP
jgi:hypothetical protein